LPKISVAFVQSVSLKFDWVNNPNMKEENPILSVVNVDTKDKDEVIFELENPPCFLVGNLRRNPDVRVRLTEGCPFENEFTVNFQ